MDCSSQASFYAGPTHAFFIQTLYSANVIFSSFFFPPQCSEPCGYGVQSRAVSCMGPSAPEPLSPLLCMHMPKPITIQGCNSGSCDTVSPTLRHAGTQTQRVTAPSPTEGAARGRTASPAAAPPPKSSELQIKKFSHFGGAGLEANLR